MGQTWSSMRKKLEQEYICNSLKGRVQYFITRYRESHDDEGRVAVRLDGREIVKSSYFMREAVRYRIWGRGKEPDWKTTMTAVHNEGGFDIECFYAAFKYYQNHSIDESLNSEDALIRLLAVFDKRVGKRTLNDLKSKIDLQPEWLQIIYKTRLEAEGI